MQQNVTTDPILARLSAALHATYGARLERAILFGSRSRGDARPDSDYDVAVFLHDSQGLWPELRPLGEITTAILMETGGVISAKPFPQGAYNDRTLLMQEIRREGVDL
jgi:predicted nucleotidyltransferase